MTKLPEIEFITELKGPKDEKVKVIRLIPENIYRILTQHPDFKGRFRKNELNLMYEIKEEGKWVNLEDKHTIFIRSAIVNMYGDLTSLSLKMTDEAIDEACESNPHHAIKEYLDSLKWDKKPRLDDFCHKVYNTENDEYHKQAGAKFLKGMVHRVYEPGAKNDSVFIVEGHQGTYKSTSLTLLAGGPRLHIETAGRVDSGFAIKQLLEEATGGWIVEFAEGAILKKSDAENIKAFVSKTQDKVRWAYGRRTMEIPRTFVFAMTTNHTSDYLRDPSGARRFIPVRCYGKANTEWLEENRDQLFAEAMHRVFELGERNHSIAAELAESHQEERTQAIQYEDEVTEYLHKLNFTQIYDDHAIQNRMIWDAKALGNGSPNEYAMAQIGKVLSQKFKMKKKKKMKGGSVQYRYWIPTDESPEFLIESETEKASRIATKNNMSPTETREERMKSKGLEVEDDEQYDPYRDDPEIKAEQDKIDAETEQIANEINSKVWKNKDK